MKVKLLGALDYKKLKEYLKDKIDNSEEIIEYIEYLEKLRRSEIVATSGRLSRYPGSVFEILETIENKTFAENVKFIKNVTKMGHDSITDHDYCIFAIKDVSPVVEQTIIAERFSSFTIKSRREVDFSTVGYYTPDFHSESKEIIENNEEVKKEYQEHMNYLFDEYTKFTEYGINKEDARFILPYSYHSNIIMGIDAHTVKDMIIKLTKTKYSRIQELKEFGEKLYEIAKVDFPYIIDAIDRAPIKDEDAVDKYLSKTIEKDNYQIIDKTKLLNHSSNIDDTILIAAIMRRYQYNFEKAKDVYEKAQIKYIDFKENLMKKIAYESDKLELTQVNFQFQIPISFAVLTHLTRHRTHSIVVPDFSPTVDLKQYKIPPQIKRVLEDEYHEIFKKNKKMYEHFKNDYKIRDEDLVYFTLSGNMVNILTNMNGKTLEHILGLRECNKTQWETKIIAHDMHAEINKLTDAQIFSTILGAKCMTQGYCPEGKESCGKILSLKNQKEV